MNRLKTGGLFLFITAMLLGIAFDAHANNISAINTNIVTSISNTPMLVSGLSYLLGLILGMMGVVKLKQHVEDPRSTPLREPVIRFLAGGALLAIPSIYDAAVQTIGVSPFTDVQAAASGEMGVGGAVIQQNINTIFRNIVQSAANTPNLISAFSYLLGLMFGVSAILQLKDHVQSPENVPLRSGMIRMIAAGSLLALPTVFEAAYRTIFGAGGALNLHLLAGVTGTSYENAGSACGAAAGSLGTVVCNLYHGTASFPILLIAASYLFGIVLIVWGILKFKDYVVDPSRGSIWEGLSRMIAGGGMLALPMVADAASQTLNLLIPSHQNTGFNGTAAGLGLDRMMADFLTSIFGPMDIIINFFGYVAGVILIMIGISRLLKSAQEGPRGPGGIGTLMTFITGGALLSFSPMISAFTMSLFNGETTTIAALQYNAGLQPDEIAHIQAVISAMLQFVLILGLISFMRGIFIVRKVAEGDQQASMMAGVTHLIGGALAVNLGPFLNAVQTTLGLAGYGVAFN